MITIIRQVDSKILELDGATKESYNPSDSSTDHAIEDGGEVTDHVRKNAEEFTVSVRVTESPFAPSAAGVTVGDARIQEVLAFLRGCRGGKIVDVVTTRNGTYKNCIITGFPHDFDVKRRVDFTISFKQVRFAKALAVVISPLQPKPEVKAGVIDEKDAGVQPLNVETGPKVEESGSTVWNIFN